VCTVLFFLWTGHSSLGAQWLVGRETFSLCLFYIHSFCRKPEGLRTSSVVTSSPDGRPGMKRPLPESQGVPVLLEPPPHLARIKIVFVVYSVEIRILR